MRFTSLLLFNSMSLGQSFTACKRPRRLPLLSSILICLNQDNAVKLMQYEVAHFGSAHTKLPQILIESGR